jgi:hypothetical protein
MSTPVAFCNRCSRGLSCPMCEGTTEPTTNVAAGHPRFMEIVALKNARDAIDKAIRGMVDVGPSSAAAYIRVAQHELANTAEKITLWAMRGEPYRR